MTEVSPEPTAIEIEQGIHGQSVDWYLQELVGFANTSGLEMGLTLNVGGSVVSGKLISGRKYFETFAEQFASAWPGDEESRANIYKSLAAHAEIYDSTETEDLPPPQYVHLADARVHSPTGSLPTNSGVLWRGKVNAVSGFSLGSLSVGDA